MSDEIKEILDKAKEISDYGADGKQHTRMFNQFEAKALLDYITNLQTIEREYSGLLSENAELQQENENLKDFNNKLQATKDRLDKYDKENQLEIDRLNNTINELERRFNQELELNNKWEVEDTQQFYSKKWYRGVLRDFKNVIKELKENNNAKD